MEAYIANILAPEQRADRPKVKTYGFLEVPTIGQVFFHQEDIDSDLQWVGIGDVVNVGRIVKEDRGHRGYDIVWLRRATDEDRERAREYAFRVKVVHVNAERGFAFGCNGNDPNEVMLHISDFADYDNFSSPSFEKLARGQYVRCFVRQTDRGPRGKMIALEEQ
jgi:cold shock CspA family protein